MFFSNNKNNEDVPEHLRDIPKKALSPAEELRLLYLIEMDKELNQKGLYLYKGHAIEKAQLAYRKHNFGKEGDDGK